MKWVTVAWGGVGPWNKLLWPEFTFKVDPKASPAPLITPKSRINPLLGMGERGCGGVEEARNRSWPGLILWWLQNTVIPCSLDIHSVYHRNLFSSHQHWATRGRNIPTPNHFKTTDILPPPPPPPPLPPHFCHIDGRPHSNKTQCPPAISLPTALSSRGESWQHGVHCPPLTRKKRVFTI